MRLDPMQHASSVDSCFAVSIGSYKHFYYAFSRSSCLPLLDAMTWKRKEKRKRNWRMWHKKVHRVN